MGRAWWERFQIHVLKESAVGLLTTYVCDCCGAQSSDLSKFATVPAQFALGTFAGLVTGCLLCTICAGDLQTAGNVQWNAMVGSKKGVQL